MPDSPPLSTSFVHPIASTGADATFARLSYEDIFASILPAYVERLRKDLLIDLREVGADKSEMIAELSALREEWADPSLADFQKLTATQLGKLQVVKFAYDKANPGAGGSLVLTAGEIFDVLNLLLDPLGYTYIVKAPEPEPAPAAGDAATGEITPPTEEKSPDPQKPLCYGQ